MGEANLISQGLRDLLAGLQFVRQGQQSEAEQERQKQLDEIRKQQLKIQQDNLRLSQDRLKFEQMQREANQQAGTDRAASLQSGIETLIGQIQAPGAQPLPGGLQGPTGLNPEQQLQTGQLEAAGQLFAGGEAPLARALATQALAPPAQPEEFTLSPGQVRFQGGEPIAAVPREARQPTSFFQAQVERGATPEEAFTKELALRERITSNPTRTDLAIRAAKGDEGAKAALELLKEPGLDIQFDDQGRVLSVSTGAKQPGRIPQATITRSLESVQSAVSLVELTNNLTQSILASPGAGTFSGDLRLLGTRLRDTIVLSGATPTGKQARQLLASIENVRDVSELKTLENLLVFRVALIANPDGRISDADVRNAQRTLGVGGTLRSPADLLSRLEVVRDLGTANYERSSALLRQAGFDVPPLPATKAPDVQIAPTSKTEEPPARDLRTMPLEELGKIPTAELTDAELEIAIERLTGAK